LRPSIALGLRIRPHRLTTSEVRSPGDKDPVRRLKCYRHENNRAVWLQLDRSDQEDVELACHGINQGLISSCSHFARWNSREILSVNVNHSILYPILE